MLRRSVNNRDSRRAYKSRASKTHPLNLKRPRRGGIRL